MGLGSKKQDYKTRERNAQARIMVHIELTKELIAQGKEAKEASKEAYQMVIQGKVKERVNTKIKELKTSVNKT